MVAHSYHSKFAKDFAKKPSKINENLILLLFFFSLHFSLLLGAVFISLSFQFVFIFISFLIFNE